MEFLDGGLLKLMSNILKSGALRAIAYNQEYGKLKKRIPLPFSGVFQRFCS